MKVGKGRDAPRKVYELSVDHWIFSAIVPTLPGWFALFATYFGSKIGLLEVKGNERHLTGLGATALVIVFVVCTLFALVRSYVTKYEKGISKNSVTVLQRLLSSVNAVTGAKLERFIEFIRDHKGPLLKNPFAEITQPEKQIGQILENLRSALGEIHDIGRDQISVSLVCKKADEWCWLGRVNGVGDLELPRLVEAQTSFHLVMIEKQASTLFYPDKSLAEASRCYVASDKDQQYGGVGSIIVRNLSLETNQEILPVALSINTYGLQFCEQDDHEARRKILEVVLPCFESRLRLELCLYHIKNQMVEIKDTASGVPGLPA